MKLPLTSFICNFKAFTDKQKVNTTKCSKSILTLKCQPFNEEERQRDFLIAAELLTTTFHYLTIARLI